MANSDNNNIPKRFEFSAETLALLDNDGYAQDLENKINETLGKNFAAIGNRTEAIEANGWLKSRVSDIETVAILTNYDIPELKALQAYHAYFTDITHLDDLGDLGNSEGLAKSLDRSFQRYDFVALDIAPQQYEALNVAEQAIVSAQSEHFMYLANSQRLSHMERELNDAINNGNIDVFSEKLDTHLQSFDPSALLNKTPATLKESLELQADAHLQSTLVSYDIVRSIFNMDDVLAKKPEGHNAYWLAAQSKVLELLENVETPEEQALAQQVNELFQTLKPEGVTYDYTRFGYNTVSPDPAVDTQTAIQRDPDWLKAVATFYAEKDKSFTTNLTGVAYFDDPANVAALEALKNGKMPEGVPEEALTDLSNWGATITRFFTMNTGVAANIAVGFEEKYGSNGAAPAVAFQRMLDSYNNFGFFKEWRATAETAAAIVTDPMNGLAVAAGAVTGGTAGAAIRGAAETTKVGLRYSIARLIQNQIMNKALGKALAAGYTEGTAAGLVQSWAEQTSEVAAGKTQDISVLRMFTDSQFEASVGMGFSAGGHFAAKLFKRGNSAPTPTPEAKAPENSENALLNAEAAHIPPTTADGVAIVAKADDVSPTATKIQNTDADEVTDTITVIASQPNSAAIAPVEASNVIDARHVFARADTVEPSPAQTPDIPEVKAVKASSTVKPVEPVEPETVAPVVPQHITASKPDNDNIAPSAEDIKMVVNGSPLSPVEPVDAVSNVHLVVANDATPVSPVTEFNTITASAGDGGVNPGAGPTGPNTGQAGSTAGTGTGPDIPPGSAKPEGGARAKASATAEPDIPQPKNAVLEKLDLDSLPDNWWKDEILADDVTQAVLNARTKTQKQKNLPLEEIPFMRNTIRLVQGRVNEGTAALDDLANILPEEKLERIMRRREMKQGFDPSASQKTSASPAPAPEVTATTKSAEIPATDETVATTTSTKTEPEKPSTATKTEEPEKPETGGDEVDGDGTDTEDKLRPEGSEIPEEITPAAKVDNAYNVFPAPKQTWAHRIAQFAHPERFIFPTANISDASQHLPNVLAQGLFGLPDYIKPFIGAKDRIIHNSEIYDGVSTLNQNLELAKRTVIDNPNAATKQAVQAAHNFVTNNADNIKNLKQELDDLAAETQLELDLLLLAKERRVHGSQIKLKETGDTKADKADHEKRLKDAAERLIDEYENTTGRTFHERKNRVDYAVKNHGRRFHLEKFQAEALIRNLNKLREPLAEFSDSETFLQNYAQAIQGAAAGGDKNGINAAISEPFDSFAKFIEDSDARYQNKDNLLAPKILQWFRSKNPFNPNSLDPVNTPWFIPRGTTNPIENLKYEITALRYGYENPFRRELDIQTATNATNAEKLTMAIEDLDLSDASQANTLAGMIKMMYKQGEEAYAIEVIARLNDKSGRAGTRELLDAFLSNETKKPSHIAGAGEHYEYFMGIIGEHLSPGHSPEKGGQRHVRELISSHTSGIQYATKFAGTSWYATPGKIMYFNDPVSITSKRFLGFLTGGRIVPVIKKVDNAGKILGDAPADYDGKTQVVKELQYWKSPSEKLQQSWNEATGITGFFSKNASKAFYYIKDTARIGAKAVFNWTISPFLPGWYATKAAYTFNNKMLPRYAGIIVAGGLVLHGGEELTEAGIEAAFGTDTWITNEQGNIVVFGGHDLDAGSRLMSGGMGLLEAGLLPLKLEAQLAGPIAASVAGGLADITIKDEQLWGYGKTVKQGVRDVYADTPYYLSKISTDTLDENGLQVLNPHRLIESGWFGDRGEGVETQSPEDPPSGGDGADARDAGSGNGGVVPPGLPTALTGAQVLRMANFNLQGTSINNLNDFHAFIVQQKQQNPRVAAIYERVLDDMNTTRSSLQPVAEQLRAIQDRLGVPLTMPAAGATTTQTSGMAASVASTIASANLGTFDSVSTLFNKLESENLLNDQQKDWFNSNEANLNEACKLDQGVLARYETGGLHQICEFVSR